MPHPPFQSPPPPPRQEGVHDCTSPQRGSLVRLFESLPILVLCEPPPFVGRVAAPIYQVCRPVDLSRFSLFITYMKV